MNQNNSPISCDVCLDLLPLVRDNIASNDSKELVLLHLEGCESCRNVYEHYEAPRLSEADDIKTIVRIRNKLFFCGIFLLLCGAFAGVYLSDSMGMFYNIILMPLLGAIGYLLLRKRWYLIVAGVFILSYFWMLVKYILESRSLSPQLFGLPLFFTLIYSFLVLLGVLIGELLRYAFHKKTDQQN